MSSTESPILTPATRWHRATLAEWYALDERTRTTYKVMLLIVVTVIAYHYSITSLVQTVGLDTPLAYVGLVPLIACALGWFNRTPRRTEPSIHDRQLDYTLGLSLLGAAVLGQAVLPSRLGAMYWVNRLDLLFLPLFVSGSTILLFGARVAWRQKVALAYLFLAWPWIYTNVLLGALGGFTSLTLKGLDASLDLVRVATPVAGNPGLFSVVHAGRIVPISVVSACSGIDGMVGFVLIGTAMGSVVAGSLPRKALWLCTGLTLLWVTNLLRLLLIFWAGHVAGPHLALDVLHPAAGLVMFCVGVAIMAALLRPFGLKSTRTGVSSGGEVPRAADAIGGAAAPRVFAVTAILIAAALVLSVSDAGLYAYNPVAAATGEPKLGSFLADPASPPGWTPTFETEYTLGQPLFGSDSRWFRYLYTATAPNLSLLHSTLPVTADVIDAGSLTGFDAYGVTACYSFHGYTLEDVASVYLGDGITGQALSYSGGTSLQNWSIVYWIWPVETGSGIRYERVILYLQNTPWGTVSLAPQAPGEAVLTQELRHARPIEHRLLVNRAFLVDFARAIVSGQTHKKDTAVLIGAVQAPSQTAAFWSAMRDNSHLAGRGGDSHAGPITPAEFWSTYRLDHETALQASSGRN